MLIEHKILIFFLCPFWCCSPFVLFCCSSTFVPHHWESNFQYYISVALLLLCFSSSSSSFAPSQYFSSLSPMPNSPSSPSPMVYWECVNVFRCCCSIIEHKKSILKKSVTFTQTSSLIIWPLPSKCQIRIIHEKGPPSPPVLCAMVHQNSAFFGRFAFAIFHNPSLSYAHFPNSRSEFCAQHCWNAPWTDG